eukprot:COSAG02_NODE_884_length_16193_cov_20.464086_14_plen_54_part_00
MRATCRQDDSSVGPLLLLLVTVVWYVWCQCVGESDEESDDAPVADRRSAVTLS